MYLGSHLPHSRYMPERMGKAVIEPTTACVAGSFQSFTLTYTAGYFGIDDTGSLKICWRFATDMGKPQFDDPTAPNYTTAEASNGAVLELRFDQKGNYRPWDKTLLIRVQRGFLREGDRITIRYGDPRRGSPGLRVQTCCEETFEFKVLVDAFATYHYVELPQSPTIAVVPGDPVLWEAVLPTLRRVGDQVALGIKAEDRWGNPSDRIDRTVQLRGGNGITGLPDSVRFRPGDFAHAIDGLIASAPGDWRVDVLDEKGGVLATSNPLRIMAETDLRPYWGDLHSQSEETIGTNSARDMFLFARDRAFLDVASHQGNDFQVTTPFWNHLNELTREFNQDHRFVVFPGYEWSGNTGLGGDRNVLFMTEGRQIHRSSHALIEDHSDIATDANSAEALFQALKDEDCVVFAHIGGRYADITMAHDVRLERAVEVHSDWGTFEWLIEDGLKQGYRIGIVANSDGHKGRPGASYPGASLFGAYGGLTCLLARDLTRAGIIDAMRRRHHYATTGCRLVLDTRVTLDRPATLFDDDPNLGTTGSRPATSAMMGDILRTDADEVTLEIDLLADRPIERVEIRNGLDVLETWRPYDAAALGRRIRVIWQGSEYRGRGRQTVWDGTARLDGNRFTSVEPINFYNLDKTLQRIDSTRLKWSALTTGGFGGFEAMLADPRTGTLAIDTGLVKAIIPIAEIGLEDRVFEAGGLARRLRAFRLPDDNRTVTARLSRRIKLHRNRDNALYVCVTQADGHLAWSSPIYLFH
jgi:hypothetical protein